MARGAARLADDHACPLEGWPPALLPPPIHVGGMLLPTDDTVKINKRTAVRVADPALCASGLVPLDTVRGGLMTVMINKRPASRIQDQMDRGNITTGSDNVFFGEWAPGPLSERQAAWLYEYIAAREEIPFGYANDGCFVRADRMADYMLALGIPVKKHWVAARDSSFLFYLPIEGHENGGVFWSFHVAPTVEVRTASGTVPMIIDPSVSPGGPLSVEDWKKKFIWSRENVDVPTSGAEFDDEPGWQEGDGSAMLVRDGIVYFRTADGTRSAYNSDNLGFEFTPSGIILMRVPAPDGNFFNVPLMTPDRLWEHSSEPEMKTFRVAPLPTPDADGKVPEIERFGVGGWTGDPTDDINFFRANAVAPDDPNAPARQPFHY